MKKEIFMLLSANSCFYIKFFSVFTQFWRCEYCDLGNILSQTDTDLPRHEDMTYVLSPGSESGDDTVIIFCVDISGSMAVTSEVLFKNLL